MFGSFELYANAFREHCGIYFNEFGELSLDLPAWNIESFENRYRGEMTGDYMYSFKEESRCTDVSEPTSDDPVSTASAAIHSSTGEQSDVTAVSAAGVQ